MNFDPVGVDERGMYYMRFHKPYTPYQKINMLQRSILVNSFAYYELNENLLSDHQYDANARQLAELKKQYPEEFARSRYHAYFYDYGTDEDGIHYTSGFDLIERVKALDADLYRRIWIDAIWAADTKAKRSNTE